MSFVFDDADKGTKEVVAQLETLAKKRESEGRGSDALVIGLAAHMVRLAAERDVWKYRALQSVGLQSETTRRSDSNANGGA